MKTAIAMILAALATTSTATAPVANATETKNKSGCPVLRNRVPHHYCGSNRHCMVSHAHYEQFRNARRKRMGSL